MSFVGMTNVLGKREERLPDWRAPGGLAGRLVYSQSRALEDPGFWGSRQAFYVC